MKSKFLMLAIAAMMMSGVDAAQLCANLNDFGGAYQFTKATAGPLAGNPTRAGDGVRLADNGALLTINIALCENPYIMHVLPGNDQVGVRAIRVFGRLEEAWKFIIRHQGLANNVPVTFIGKNGTNKYRTTVGDIRTEYNNARTMDNFIDAAL